MLNVLIPYDFTPASERILRAAQTLSERLPLSAHLLHVASEDEVMEAAQESQFNDFVDYIKNQEQKIQELTQKYPDIDLDGMVLAGKLEEEIFGYMERHNSDLIMMTSSGASGVDELLVGSNAEHIVRHSPKPVMVLKGPDTELKLDNILLPTRADDQQENDMDFLRKLAKAFGAKIHLLMVQTGTNISQTDKLHELLSNFAEKHLLPNYETHVQRGRKIEEEISQWAHNHSIGLIAMATHQRTGISHFFGGSITEGLVNHIDLPVLTFSYWER